MHTSAVLIRSSPSPHRNFYGIKLMIEVFLHVDKECHHMTHYKLCMGYIRLLHHVINSVRGYWNNSQLIGVKSYRSHTISTVFSFACLSVCTSFILVHTQLIFPYNWPIMFCSTSHGCLLDNRPHNVSNH